MLTLHGYDGREVQLDAAHVGFVRPIKIGNEDVTRINLLTGMDVVVREAASFVLGHESLLVRGTEGQGV